MMNAKTANEIANERFQIVMRKKERMSYRRIARDIRKAIREGKFYVDYYFLYEPIHLTENIISSLTVDGYKISSPIGCIRISWDDKDLREVWKEANNL